jgi:hypothetical protein
VHIEDIVCGQEDRGVLKPSSGVATAVAQTKNMVRRQQTTATRTLFTTAKNTAHAPRGRMHTRHTSGAGSSIVQDDVMTPRLAMEVKAVAGRVLLLAVPPPLGLIKACAASSGDSRSSSANALFTMMIYRCR